eukprot:CAMPEP_0197539786 /NCGR_PEP_ID=MMETSP1318-20131121/63786_2 /TAXON_ID=552666 /ORGANISM="Partenskyella glossopodia, Strain RCC365" /LENGTH=170 /DNA_ID=CAMNT_0043098583 /DNA_START=168 /DNA_END=677 /DNA_ORIENTATION=-
MNASPDRVKLEVETAPIVSRRDFDQVGVWLHPQRVRQRGAVHADEGIEGSDNLDLIVELELLEAQRNHVWLPHSAWVSELLERPQDFILIGNLPRSPARPSPRVGDVVSPKDHSYVEHLALCSLYWQVQPATDHKLAEVVDTWVVLAGPGVRNHAVDVHGGPIAHRHQNG